MSSALVVTEIQYLFKFRDKHEALKHEHKLILKTLEMSNSVPRSPEYFYSWCMNQVLECAPISNKNRKECHMLFKIACKTTQVSQHDWMGSCLTAKDISLADLIIRVYDRKCKLDDVFDRITYSTELVEAWEAFGVTGKAYGNLHLVNQYEGSKFIITHPHLAGIRDMASSWLDVLMYGLLYMDKYPGYNLNKEIENFIYRCVNYATIYPVEIYEVMKMWPSLCIGAILRDIEKDSTFYNALNADVPNKTHEFTRWITGLINAIFVVHLKLEMSGLGKIFGHPIIDMNASVKSWIEKGTCLKPGKSEMGQRCSNMFKLVLCRRYYEERNRWPKFEPDGRGGTSHPEKL